jgi:H+/gluconate symporter-like permease
MKPRHIAISLSLILMAVGTWMGLVNSHTIDFPSPEPRSAAEKENFERRGKTERISSVIFFSGFIILTSIPLIDFYKWAKD